MTTDLERAFKALSDKSKSYTTLFDYYNGDQPLLYTNKRLAEVFRGLDAVFTENWCAVVVDSERERLRLLGMQIEEQGPQERINALYESSELSLEADNVHEAALVAGEAFVIAWPDEENTPQAYYNDPRMVHVFYDVEHPRTKRWAAKWWVDEDELVRMTLYYPDRLEFYRSNKKSPQAAGTFEPFNAGDGEMIGNPYDEVPVFHFRNTGRMVRSEIKNVVPVQNGINKLLTDMMVAAEYGAFRQRYVISNAEILGQLKNAPNEVWEIPAGDGIGQSTAVGQFEATELKNYLEAIDNLATAISAITRTPKHYFFTVGSNLSGEALQAMEAPLNKKAADFIDRMKPTWKQLAQFMLKIDGLTVEPRTVQVMYEKPERIFPKTEAEVRKANVESGIPLVTALREDGWSEERIQRMLKDKEKEAEQNRLSLGQALVEAERRFGQNTNGAGQANSTTQQEE